MKLLLQTASSSYLQKQGIAAQPGILFILLRKVNRKAAFKVPLRALGNLTCTLYSHFFMVLGMEPRASGTLNKCSTTKPLLQPYLHYCGHWFLCGKTIYPLRGCSLFLRRRNSYKVLNLNKGYLSKDFRRMIVLPPRDGFQIFAVMKRTDMSKTQDTKELSQIPCGFGIALFRIKDGLELNSFA